MEYESTILKRLIDTYGVVGNPRYISEIIKEFIVRGKGCFPNLFTYQADWLAHIDEFGLNPTYTVSYTGHSIYAPNTLERPVKSAILKGNTLVNIHYEMHTDILNQYWTVSLINLSLLKPSTKYLIKIKNLTSEDKSYYNDTICEFTEFRIQPNSSLTKIITSKNEIPTTKDFLKNNVTHELPNDLKVLFIEYQDGMENWDIPYFTGMQSVKMPVLTTSNEDGTKTNILTVNEDVTLRSNGNICDELNLLTGQLTQRIDEDGEVLSQEVVKTVDLTILDQNGQNVKQLMSFNGGTHFNTTSLEGSPLPVVSVSVETDLEEILMMCSLEGNTM